MRIVAFAACALALAGQAQVPPKEPIKTAGKSALDKANLEAYLRVLELWPPQIQVQIGNPKPFVRGLFAVAIHLSSGPAAKDITYYVSADGKTVIRGDAYNIDRNPFQNELENLTTEHQPSFGPANAPLTMVVFSDFECPVCREEAKELRAKAPVEAAQDLRVVFTDFPLESIHVWAKAAALAGRCVYHQNPAAFWDYHDWIFEHQTEINAGNLRSKIVEWAGSKHLDTDLLGRCIDTRATASEVDAEIARGKKLQVDSTPTAFLNGRRLVGGIPWQNLSAILKLELEFLKHSEK